MHTLKSITGAGLLAAGILVIGGCAGTHYGSSSPTSVAPNSVVQVNQKIDIPDGKARVYFQYGAQIGSRDFDAGIAHCYLLMQSKHKKGLPRLTVEPGSFEISKLRRHSDLYDDITTAAVSTSTSFRPPVLMIYNVDIRLQSDQQPNVRSLVCSKHVNRAGPHYPTQAEISEALGDVINIEVL